MEKKQPYTPPHLLKYGPVATLTRHHRTWHDPQGKVSIGPDAFTEKSLDEELGS